MSMRNTLGRLTACAATLVLASGCMFQMNHRFPPNTIFGGASAATGGAGRGANAPTLTSFQDSRMKNYLLAGLVPYTGFGTKNLAAAPNAGQRLAVSEVETTFNALDTLIWVVPGFFYGYYVWAPRHVGMTARYVATDAPVVPAVAR
jgi:hypothetical protein